MSNPHSPTSKSLVVSPNRRTHRKRTSALRLSSDTTSTLPEYIPTGGWSQTTKTTTTTTKTKGTGRPEVEAGSESQFGVHQGLDPPLDLPPDYSDSAEEADEDTDVEVDNTFEGGLYNRHREHRQQQEYEYVPQFTVYGGPHHHSYPRASSRTKSPRKSRRHPSHNQMKSVGSTSSLKSPSFPPSTQSARTSPPVSPSASDVFLDSLLERSVNALEMSNALLQSSMNTRSTLSNLISAGTGPDSDFPPRSETLGVPERGSRSFNGGVSDQQFADLESRINTWKNVRETWADDLDEIKTGVERLFGGGERGASVDDTEVEVGRDSQSNRRRRDRSDGSISSSMPAESPLKQRIYSSRRYPNERSISSASIDARPKNYQQLGEDDNGSTPQLRFGQQQRERLVAQPPRALTQYVAANSDTDTLVLPSTLGLRSTSSSHRVMTDRTDIQVAAKGGAYSMLSSLASRSAGPIASATSTPSSTLTSPKKGSGSSSIGSNSHLEQHVPYKRRNSTSPTRSRSWVGIMGRSRSETPKPAVGKCSMSNGPGACRRMTPPIESLSSPSQSSSSSSEENDGETSVGDQRRRRGPSAKRTVQELRRILDEQPSPQPDAKFEIILRPPALLRKVGGTGTTAEVGTSNATASVSRLLTKNKHSSSTRPPSPPRQSALKGRSVPGTPTTPATPGPPPTSSAVEAAVQAAHATAKPVSDSPAGSGSAFRMPQVFSSFARTTFPRNGKGKANQEDLLSTPTLSPSGSGASTPKRISFAELPESYSGGNGKRRSSRKSNSRHGRKRSLSDSDEVENDGWFGWLIGGSVSTSRHDRMEDRLDRSWGNGSGRLIGGGVYSSGMDDWAV
ncbi:hypothetical protein E1B28_004806 [Marasmius oreades]|uniref:Uncharacterized protein n=1 Tax=Marasmius oreades TaxID=181124 RepID=A0A9P7UZE2_9AGAR|nr:uncharacterized protein E1B28_004806 [Marasmius oreades]KAG7097462.1 hypothetical protein E1B28_004806 [Marasmius oreades]